MALAEADGLVPEVPAVLELDGAVFRMNFVSLDALDAPAVPDVPVGLELALERSMHPVRVTLSAELELGVCDDGGGVVCAAAIVTVHAIAAHIPDHTLFVIVSS
ncbi:MAG: hypothetical protein DMF98_18240 [Acidobacteria bacterium]|nr:MAG: hypothetical protein DMF98_18240 [Acidobacteriota bacterium]